MNKLVGMLRVKNEARWILEVLNSISFCDQVFIFDDHSSDGTDKMCAAWGAFVVASSFSGLDEARDKDSLLRVIRASCDPGTWVIHIDGDEILEFTPEQSPDQFRKLSEAGGNGYRLRIQYLWNSRDQVRIDGVYGRFWRPSIFKLSEGPMNFRRTVHGRNFHCSSVPEQCLGRCRDLMSASLLHLGYMHAEDRVKKWMFYRREDPGNKAEDEYRHIVIGDVYPADSHFLHAGPLKLEPLVSAGGIISGPVAALVGE